MKVVFVHGALVFDGAWWWHRMVEPLAALGLGSRAVELPSCAAPSAAHGESPGDMYADADAVRAALDEEDGPIVLVGHSYGGMLITDAAAGHGHVEHLVYVTSVMPERDETLADLGGGGSRGRGWTLARRTARWASRPSWCPTPSCRTATRRRSRGRWSA